VHPVVYMCLHKGLCVKPGTQMLHHSNGRGGTQDKVAAWE